MEESGEKGKALVRELHKTSLLTVVEPILKSGATAHLHVELGGEDGDFFFENGRMICARASAIKNQEAAYYLISWRNGTFVLRKIKEMPEQNVEIDWMDFIRFYEEEIEKIVLSFVPRIEGGICLELRDPRGHTTFHADYLKKQISAEEKVDLLGDPRIEKAYGTLSEERTKALKLIKGGSTVVVQFLPETRYFVLAIFPNESKYEDYEKWLDEQFEPKAIEAVSIALEMADKKRIRGTILVIDDSPTTRAIMEDTLTEYRFKVQTAEDGYEGLVMAREIKPDMIFLDVMMPKLDGYEVLKRLRKEEEFKSLPIVMLTSKGLATDKGEAFKEGANLYIEKPFTTKKILTIVENVLGLD